MTEISYESRPDERDRPQVMFWLILSGYVVGAISIALVLTSVSSITSSYSSPGAASTTAATATTSDPAPLDNHSNVTDNRFPLVVPLANDPQSRHLEALMLADGNDQSVVSQSASDAHCVQDSTQPTQARPLTDVGGTTSVWNCDITRGGRFGGQFEYAVVWNGGDNPPRLNPSDPPTDWSMYERSN
jgi:hypothetical protein